MRFIKQFAAVVICILFLTLSSTCLMAQVENTNLIATSTDAHPTDSNYPFVKNNETTAAHLMDISKLKDYVSKNLDYPIQAQSNGVEGEVIAKVIIDKKGKVNAVKIVQGLGFGCDSTVIQLLSEMPDWKPFLRAGYPVMKTLFIKINFRME